MNMSAKTRASCLFVTWLIAVPVMAAGPDGLLDDPARRMLEQERARQRDERLQREVPSIKTEAQLDDDGRAPADLPETGNAFPIDEIVIKGNSLIPDNDLEPVVGPFRGVPMGLNRINLLLRRLTAVYLERGYFTTRVYLGEQNLSDRRLQIDVIEGRLEKIEYNGAEPPLGVRLAFPVSKGEILRLQDLEQGVEQLNRLRRNAASITVAPGELPGGSIATIRNEQGDARTYHIGYDNGGQESSGLRRLRLGVDAEDMLGLQEAVSLAYTGSRDTNALLLSAGVPLGYHTLSYTLSYSDYLSQLGGYALLFGDTYWHNLGWNYTYARDGRGRDGIDVAISHRRGRRFINDGALTPQRLTTVRLAYNRYRRMAWGSLQGEIAYSHGVGWLGADSDARGLSRKAPSARFNKLAASAEAVVGITERWSVRTSASLQWSDRGLYGSEQMFLGGAGSVRGFAESAAGGDKGVLVRNELGRTDPGWLRDWGVRLAPYAFLDMGSVGLVGGEQKSLVSAGVGMRFSAQRVQGEIVVGVPLTRPHDYKESGARAMFSVTYRL
jgi:hemolysin activation/secretion protein